MRVNSVLADVHIRLVLAGRTLEISALKLRMKFLATITTTTASDLTAFLYQQMRDYCIGMISSRWWAKGAKVCGAGGRYPSAECGRIVL